jgi:hypothetical protein
MIISKDKNISTYFTSCMPHNDATVRGSKLDASLVFSHDGRSIVRNKNDPLSTTRIPL